MPSQIEPLPEPHSDLPLTVTASPGSVIALTLVAALLIGGVVVLIAHLRHRS